MVSVGKDTNIYPRLPNTKREEVFGPQNIPKTSSEEVFGRLGLPKLAEIYGKCR